MKHIIPGGDDFLHSCMNGMFFLAEKSIKEDKVIISSADRPLMSEEEIVDSINVCNLYGSGIAARPCLLCMFEVNEEKNHWLSGIFNGKILLNLILKSAPTIS